MADETTSYKEYASKQYVEDAIEAIEIPEVSAIEITEIESICV